MLISNGPPSEPEPADTSNAYVFALSSLMNWNVSPLSQVSDIVSVLSASLQQSKLEQVPLPPKMVKDCSIVAPAGRLNGLASKVKEVLSSAPKSPPVARSPSGPDKV